MKRWIKLFEEFKPSGAREAFWLVQNFIEGTIYGVFESPEEAGAEWERQRDQWREWQWKYEDPGAEPWQGWKESLFFKEGDIGIEKIRLDDEDRGENIFLTAVMDKDYEAVKSLILIGLNPGLYFDSFDELKGFFKGDLTWYPGGEEALEKRMRSIKLRRGMF